MDAMCIDYKKLFRACNAPKIIDYLSLDLEPPLLTFELLQLLPFDEYKFKVITFEHDDYREEFKHLNLKEKSRDFFKKLGYIRIEESVMCQYDILGARIEDWYVLET